MISQQRAEELANKILQDKISSAEEQEWQDWYHSNLEDPIEVPESFAPSKAIHAARMMGVINGAIAVKRPVRLWPRIAVAAAAVAAIVFGIWFYKALTPQELRSKTVRGDVAYKNDIGPGRNTATLTLATGKVINLDTSRTSVVVADSVKAMTMLTAATPRGGTYQMVLSDGSRVWLNADTRISFPSQFNGKERKILLQGEAYFEVAHNESRPFMVESEGQQVEVLGTHFNINSYANEGKTSTTLLEGSVRIGIVEDGKKGAGVLLKPNEQSVLDNGKISVKQVETSYAIAWKEGYFMFNSERLEIAMNKIARWYNLTIEYEDATLKEETIFGTISKYENVSQVLKMLEKTGVLVFEIEGKTLKVKRNKTKN